MAGPAYQNTPAGPVYTRGDQAFLRDRTGKIVTVAPADAARLLDEDPNYLPVSAEDVAARDVEIARSTLGNRVAAFGESAAAGAADVPLIPIRAGMRAGYALGGVARDLAGKEPLTPAEAGLADPDKTTGRAAFEQGVGALSGALGADDLTQAATVEQYRQDARERRQVLPGTTAAGTMAGQLPYAFVGPGAALGNAAAGSGFVARVGAQALGGAIEGAAFGESQATDDAYIEDKPLTAEKLMASMGWGSLIGGVAGGTLGALGEGFGAIQGTAGRRLGREAVSDEAAQAFGGRARQQTTTAAAESGVDARIADAADSAGLNPAARREAARQEAATVVKEAQAVDPANWREFTKKATPEAQYLHRDSVLNAASNETAQDLTSVLDRQAPIYGEIDNLQVKRGKIAEHLAADNVDQTAVIGRAQQETAELRARIASVRAETQARQAALQHPTAVDIDAQGLVNAKYARDGMRDMTDARSVYKGASKQKAQEIALNVQPVDVAVYPDGVALSDGRHRMLAAKEAGAKRIAARVRTYDGEGSVISEELRPVSIDATGKAKAPRVSSAEKALNDMDMMARDHEARILAAQTGEDAIGEFDSLRRELSKRWRTSRGSARAAQNYEDRALMELVQPFAKQEYERAAQALMDESFVGKTQAAAQKSVNNARVGSINGERYDLRPFVVQTGSEEGADFGGRVFTGNQDSIRGMLSGLGDGGGGVRADQFARYIDSQQATLAAIRDNYALSAGASKSLNESLAALEKMRGTVATATDAANAVNRAKARIEADQIGGGFLGKLAASTAVGASTDGAAGAARGFARGLLGGAGPTLELQQRMATLSAESKLAAWLEQKISKVSGTAGKGAAVVNQTANGVDRKVQSAMDSYFSRLTTKAGRVGELAQKPVKLGRAAAAPIALKLFMGDEKQPAEAYRKRTEQLLVMNQNLGQGVRDRTTAALGGISETAPRLTQHVAVAASRGVNYLLAHTPVPLRQPSVMQPSYRPTPSDLEIAEFAKRWSAVADPLTVLEDFQRGMVTYEQVDALKNVYPSLFRSIQVEALQRFQQLDQAGIPVPYQDRLQADLMFDLHGAGDPTLDPGFALKVSGMMQAAAAKNSSPKPGSKPLNVAKSYASESQAIGATLRGAS